MFTTKNLLLLIGRHALIAFGAGLIAVFAVSFLGGQIQHITTSIIQNHKLVNTLEKRTELFSILKRDTEIIGTSDTLMSNAFVPSDNILDFVSALESLATKNSLTQNFHFDTPTPSPIPAPFPLSTITYSNTLPTNILTLSNYLKDFERLPYFTKIDSLVISSQDKGGLRASGTASFHATLYTKVSQ